MSTLFSIDLALRTDTELSTFFLDRLSTLVARQMAAATPGERAALGVATFSVFLDCLDLGLVEEARAIIGQQRDAMAGRAVA